MGVSTSFLARTNLEEPILSGDLSTDGESETNQFFKQVASLMQSPLEDIARVTGMIHERIKEAHGSPHLKQDLAEIMKALRVLNDYNRAMYQFSTIGQATTRLEEVRLLDVMIKAGRQIRNTYNLSPRMLLSEVTVYADERLLGRVVKELFRALIRAKLGVERMTIKVESEITDQWAHIHLIREGHPLVKQTIQAVQPFTAPKPNDLQLAVAHRIIHELQGTLEHNKIPSGEQYTLTLRRLKEKRVAHMY